MGEVYGVRIDHRDNLSNDILSIIPIREDDDTYLLLRKEKDVSVDAPVGTAVIYYGVVVNLISLPTQTQAGNHVANGEA